MLAYNEATGELAFYPIEVVWVNLDPVIVHLTINGETIETTPEHPFYTEAGEWVYAGSLLPGDEIRTAAWGVGTVEAIHFTPAPQTMYNLTVATAHTYFVGEGQWLVHNDLCWSSANVKYAAGELQNGATSTHVSSRAEAEELFLALYQGDGYVNTTGMISWEANNFYGTRAGTYHWDDAVDNHGFLVGHEGPHGAYQHLQIHTSSGVIRINYGPPLRVR